MAKKKINEQAKLQANNLIEQASDMASPCFKCGLCKELSPINKTNPKEHLSPRGQMILIKEKTIDKTIFEIPLCKGPETKCPIGIPINETIIKAREALTLKGQGMKKQEEMIKRLKKYGNPYQTNEEGKEDTSIVYT